MTACRPQRTLVLLIIIGILISCDGEKMTPDPQPLPAAAPASRAIRAADTPAPLNLEAYVKQQFPHYYGSEPYEILLVDRFFPLGWSADGKFAYILEPVDEACGCFFGKFIIQDMKTDQVIWQFENEQNESYQIKNQAAYLRASKRFWEENREQFEEKLAEFGVEMQKDIELVRGELSYHGDRIVTRASVVKDDKKPLWERLSNVKIEVQSARKGSKQIYSKSYGPNDMRSIIDGDVVGCLVSPLEARAAVILVEIHRGYEGPPHITRTRVIGCALEKGF